MHVSECFDGPLHLIEGETLYASRSTDIWKSQDYGENWFRITRFRVRFVDRLLAASRLGRRLSRRSIHHIIRINGHTLAVLAFGSVRFFDEDKGSWSADVALHGRRPLVVTTVNNRLIYGEYTSNPQRQPVHLFAVGLDGGHTSIATFRNIRHIHAVSFDPFSGKLWVTTGDEDDECGLWRMNTDGSDFRPIVRGSQQARVVQLLFAEKYVLFGTDSPLERNYIYRLDRKYERIKKVASSPSSIFYGCMVGTDAFFSTVCEPSECNETQYVAILRVTEGGRSCREVMQLRKDPLPMKLFQYGQVKFPSGENDGEFFFFTPQGTTGDQKTFRAKVSYNE